MDGELIVLDGEGYQLKSDGTVNKVTANMTSPFAVMAFFEEHQKINILQPTSYEEIQKIIVENLPSLNLFYGIKINGLFSEIKTRTVSWQEKPYPTLVKASEQQGILNVKNTNGDIVGFWTHLLPIHWELMVSIVILLILKKILGVMFLISN